MVFSIRRLTLAQAARFLLLCAVLLPLSGCNSPYPEDDEGKSILYTWILSEPKHMDTATSYSSEESLMLMNICEPPFQYHYLKRPYELAPLTTTSVPSAEAGKVMFKGKEVDAVVYRIELQRGITYQDHPCFVESNRALTEKQLKGVRAVWDLPERGTRELVAADYVLGIRRLADSRLSCPVFSTLADNMLGIGEYGDALDARVEELRAVRRAAAGALYNQGEDEKYNPILLDYAEGADAFPFVRELDSHTFEVVLKRPYPQILYWMAMPFFSPVPPEALDFYSQRELIERNIVLDRNPVGTGPYVLAAYEPSHQVIFERNANFRDERYPTLPEPPETDKSARAHYELMKGLGMLEAAGERLPMTDRIVMRMDKESIPRWNKFLQGYYDAMEVYGDMFDQTVSLGSQGDTVLTDQVAALGIELRTSFPSLMYYYGFNMQDEVVGGYTEEKRKLRQAINIAFDVEEWISIFRPGQAQAPHGPIPPGIFGSEEGRAGMNEVVYQWSSKLNHPVRRSIEDAKQLLAEAGWPNGFKDGEQLVIRFVTGDSTPEGRSDIEFMKKQLGKLNIRVAVEISDFNRFQDKIYSGNFQLMRWGWQADYPDAENFLFLLHGPNSKAVTGGENVANYANPRFDELFLKMQSMENTPERLDIIREMLKICREDSPWIFDYLPLAFTLQHEWYKNSYPNAMARNRAKYKRIDTVARTTFRREQNRPRIWPVVIFLLALTVFSLPALKAGIRHLREI